VIKKITSGLSRRVTVEIKRNLINVIEQPGGINQKNLLAGKPNTIDPGKNSEVFEPARRFHSCNELIIYFL